MLALSVELAVQLAAVRVVFISFPCCGRPESNLNPLTASDGPQFNLSVVCAFIVVVVVLVYLLDDL